MEDDQSPTSPGQDVQGQSGDKPAPSSQPPAPTPTEPPSTQPEAAVCDISEELSRQLEDIIKTYGSAASLMDKESAPTGTNRPEKGEPASVEDAEYEDVNEESEKEKVAPGDASRAKEPSGSKEQKLEKKILKGLGKYLRTYTDPSANRSKTSLVLTLPNVKPLLWMIGTSSYHWKLEYFFSNDKYFQRLPNKYM